MIFSWCYCCSVDKVWNRWRYWSPLNQKFWHVWWLFDRFVDWFPNTWWGNGLDWRMPDFFNESSRAFKWNTDLVKFWAQARVVKRLMCGNVWCNIFVELSDGLDLVDDQLRRISDNEVFSGEDFCSVLLNPIENHIISDSVMLISLNQATQSGLENVTIVIVDSPLINNSVEISQIKFSGSSTVQRLVIGKVCCA